MSLAFRCDVCGELHEGEGHLSHTVGGEMCPFAHNGAPLVVTEGSPRLMAVHVAVPSVLKEMGYADEATLYLTIPGTARQICDGCLDDIAREMADTVIKGEADSRPLQERLEVAEVKP